MLVLGFGIQSVMAGRLTVGALITIARSVISDCIQLYNMSVATLDKASSSPVAPRVGAW